jgi:hypothetical protein
MKMRELREFSAKKRAGIKYALMDIDDTLTLHGKLPSVAYSALERLWNAGIKVVPVTGRPAGWCDHIARMWPVDCVIGENGAFYFYFSRRENRIIHRYFNEEFQAEYENGDFKKRKSNLDKLLSIGEAVCGRFNSAHAAENKRIQISNDQSYRETDVAVDFAEDVPLKLNCDEAVEVQRMIMEEGEKRRGNETARFNAKISSIHVNAWYGDYDKVKMAKNMFVELFDVRFDDIADQVVFAGDSPNDAPMFAEIPNAVGVANVMEFKGIIESEPAWVTMKPGGFGFAELADALLSARS